MLEEKEEKIFASGNRKRNSQYSIVSPRVRKVVQRSTLVSELSWFNSCFDRDIFQRSALASLLAFLYDFFPNKVWPFGLLKDSNLFSYYEILFGKDSV